MPTLVPGFEYDIFISYRHNDNHSGWVTEFVKSLKEELAATIKENVSVYFDTNPYDGLLETHHVDKSLEGKLKCLIFIPILSQTYCDVKSFAWKHEFCAFNKLSQEDKLGKDIKLTNGNVASRILPVKIHDLDAEDKVLLENELGGTLRCVEFIYKAPGVNRPITLNDNPNHNLNQIFYRDQLNKVANAVKELVYSIQNRPVITPTQSHNIFTDSLHENSIAVLPFINMSSDPEQDYLCDGLSEELLNVLTQLGKVKVAARTSSFMFKGENRDITAIGKTLRVNTVLEGSVRKSGNRIRITTQLINVADGFHMWSEKYDREITDIFDIQDEIALAILNELKIKLLGEEKSYILKRNTDNIDAYQFYLQGRFNFHNFIGNGYLTAIKYYDKALEIDPNYAKAHAGKASCYLNLWHFNILTPEQSLRQMQEATFKSLELDNQIAESHYAMARYKFWHDYDLKGAEQEFLETFKFNPSIPEAISHYGFVQNFLGNKEKALTSVRRAKQLDPFSPMISLDLIANIFLAGNFEELLVECNKTIGMHPQFWGGYWYRGYYHWTNKEYDMALDNIKKVVELFPGQLSLSLLGCLYGVTNRKEEARQVIFDLEQLSKKEHVGSFSFALIYAGFGNMDKTFEYLKVAGQERTGLLIFLDYFSKDIVPILKQDSRYKPFLREVGIPICNQND